MEGILFIQEIFLEIFTCQDYMFKFLDKASSGPHAKFLKSSASIPSGFPAHKRLLLGAATDPFSEIRRWSGVLKTPVLSRAGGCDFFPVRTQGKGAASCTQAQNDVCNQILLISAGM